MTSPAVVVVMVVTVVVVNIMTNIVFVISDFLNNFEHNSAV
jgi:hypothetical protein